MSYRMMKIKWQMEQIGHGERFKDVAKKL